MVNIGQRQRGSGARTLAGSRDFSYCNCIIYLRYLFTRIRRGYGLPRSIQGGDKSEGWAPEDMPPASQDR